MTLLEKAKEIIKAEGKNLSENGIIEYSCPSDYELEEAKNCVREGIKSCEECWNREMPNAEPKHTIVDSIKAFQKEFCVHSENAIDKVLEKELKKADYEQGLNDAWELAKKIGLSMDSGGLGYGELEKIFGTYGYTEIMNIAPQEALAKLKAYEEAQKIEVGDVVKLDGTCYTYVVTVIQEESDGTYYCGLSKNGKWFAQNNVTKTGKHLDIKSILESIGE